MSIEQSKSILAKLLAQENISVEHRKTTTAYFDPKNRVLTLPIWKNMSNNVYDLLVGHEVGHAWATPPEGWHDQVTGNSPGFKTYLNVVEDARIERKIKSMYPGLKSSFYAGYRELVEQDFFGITKYNLKVNKLSLIDRLNLHFKIGPFMAVEFKPSEQVYVERMEKLETWAEVVALAKELYKKRIEELEDITEGDVELVESDEMGEDDDGDGDSTGETTYESTYDPESVTDAEFRRREKELIDPTILPYRYANLPTVDIDKCIIDYKTLYSKTEWPAPRPDVKSDKTLHDEYKSHNSRFIQYLVKEFELRRNAAQMARATVARTGELDINKAFSYKIKDDLFKRVTNIPGGKNHGMVMFVDWSGSMGDVLKATIEQTLVLADFCRKVNIPFRVFAFSDHPEASVYAQHKNIYTQKPDAKFSMRDGDMYIGYSTFYALEILSSRMSIADYNFAQQKLLFIGDCNQRRHGYLQRPFDVPDTLRLNGTPLNESIIFATKFVPAFKEQHRLDVVNTIFLTDGESNEMDSICNNGTRQSLNTKYGLPYRSRSNTIIKDRATGHEGHAKPDQPITIAFLELFRKITGTNAIGYYLINSSNKNTIINTAHRAGINANPDKIISDIKENKFFMVSDYGYSKYFIVKSSDIEITDDIINISTDDAKSSPKKLAKAFTEMQKKKLVNRVLLNRFVAEIA